MPDDALAPVTLCCFLWARPGQADALERYEDAVLALVPEHRGEVLRRVRSQGQDGQPHEVQMFRFRDGAALEAFLSDPRRLALSDERDRTVRRTELFPVDLLV